MAAAPAAGAAWCLSVVAASWSASRAGTEYSAAAPGGGARMLAEVDIRALLPVSPYQHRRAGGATCSVCLEKVRGGEMVRSLPGCRHLFHVGCIDPWLHSQVTCPLCRSDLSPRRRATMAAVAGLQGGSGSLSGFAVIVELFN
ncbi:RING-H2 finger protein ATL44-like [Panicum miliaceum]|uniref:RING-type E3 ubiquitin transferase n=1 Tax=Panicum miliaceum TaxID=4540 RepID=A0A3L6QB61_PANMI|nr:RING-H2 finger protein ATL44-like [Panicum miliaceum]